MEVLRYQRTAGNIMGNQYPLKGKIRVHLGTYAYFGGFVGSSIFIIAVNAQSLAVAVTQPHKEGLVTGLNAKIFVCHASRDMFGR